MSELASKPWECVAIDFCGPFPTGELALVIVDEYSRCPELEIVTSTSMPAIRPKLEKIFAIHGIPDLVKSNHWTVMHLRFMPKKRDSSISL